MIGVPEPTQADIQAAFCRVLCDEWARAGVTDAVVSPGSRSTPLLRALDDEERIRVHVVLDERSAGFFALGLGLAHRRPAVVVTTSGTAAVELHPAVVESAQAGVALIAVTADRPAELHHVGAPQTVEQASLFGPVLRWALDPGVPDAGGAGAWRSVASRMVAEAIGVGAHRRAGPVHLNLALREPLVGDANAFPAPPGRQGGAPWHYTEAPSTAAPVAGDTLALLEAHAGGRGLIIAGEDGATGEDCATSEDGGDGKAAGALALAECLGWPVLAEPRSGQRVPHPLVVSAADALLRVERFATAMRPDVVVRVGTPWVSKVLGQWLAELPASVPQLLLDPQGGWADPERRASHVVPAGASALAAALAERDLLVGTASGWAEAWRARDDAARSVFSLLLSPRGPLEMSEPAIARACLEAVPAGGQLFVSSSMPIRDIEWYGRPRLGARVLANRGANGIDGVLSTAAGVALGHATPTTLLVGDLAFVYDAGALLWASRLEIDMRVVVVDNGGGGIFSFLPQRASESPDRFERYWGTPHGVDLVALARAYGAQACVVENRPDLDRFLAAGGTGIRVGVVRSDRDANVAAHDRIHEEVASAMAREIP